MRRLFLTGATGFIGGRLAEIAFQRDIPTTALVRSWANASRLARLPIAKVKGDILDVGSVREAMKGCDTVIHCAVDNRVGGTVHRETSALGTRNVMQAALELGVRRVVHLSSVAVYSYKPAADAATEAGAYGVPSDDYCHGKILAEEAALSFLRDRGLPVTILRPTVVYGPFGVETVETVQALRKKTMVLVNGGTGVCNTLHVDNLVDAALLAAEHPGAVGEIFHISDAEPVTWRQFIEPHARALGEEYLPLPGMSVEEIEAVRQEMTRQLKKESSSLHRVRAALRNREVRRALKSIPLIKEPVQLARRATRFLVPSRGDQLQGQPLRVKAVSSGESAGASAKRKSIPSRGKVDIYSSNVVFRIDKARDILGYHPRVSFADGIEQTIAWMKWARL